jgi:hypothetical protein
VTPLPTADEAAAEPTAADSAATGHEPHES